MIVLVRTLAFLVLVETYKWFIFLIIRRIVEVYMVILSLSRSVRDVGLRRM